MIIIFASRRTKCDHNLFIVSFIKVHIMIYSKRSFLKQGRPTQYVHFVRSFVRPSVRPSVRLSVCPVKPKFDQLFCLSCLNLRGSAKHFIRASNFYGWLFVHFSQNLHFIIKNSTFSFSVKCVLQHFNALSYHLISELSRGKFAY